MLYSNQIDRKFRLRQDFIYKNVDSIIINRQDCQITSGAEKQLEDTLSTLIAFALSTYLK